MASQRIAIVLALCGLACATPPVPHPSTACRPGYDVGNDVAIAVVSEPSEPPASAQARACASFCSALATTCTGTLLEGTSCIDACAAWPEAALDCREDWLASGSCIGATLDSPTCGA